MQQPILSGVSAGNAIGASVYYDLHNTDTSSGMAALAPDTSVPIDPQLLQQQIVAERKTFNGTSINYAIEHHDEGLANPLLSGTTLGGTLDVEEDSTSCL
jgi:hypothetical protein